MFSAVMTFVFIVFLALVARLEIANGGKILAILPTASYSHQIIYAGILQKLNERGHEIVVVTPNPFDGRNYTQIAMQDTYQYITIIDWVKMYLSCDWMRCVDVIWEMGYHTSDAILSHPDVRKLFENGNKQNFDLLVAEMLCYPSIFAVAQKLGVPFIGISSLGLFEYDQYHLGMPVLPSHPSNWELQDGPGFNLPFFQRLKNFIRTWHYIYRSDSQFIEKHNEIARKYLGNDIPDLREISRNVSLILTNSNEVFTAMKPKVPKIIDIGGILMSCKNNTQRLPQDMEKFLNSATNGFIYVSLGTNAKSSALPEEVKAAFVNVFSKLRYKVLWKYEDDSLPDIPKNVMLSKWLPQTAVLGHPNIKLFVYQGGLQSSEEAIMHAVPLIGIPILADQMTQVSRMIHIGVAERLDIVSINEKNLLETILEVIHNRRYKEKMLHARKIYKEISEGRLERAVWWTEFVMRHGGAPFLDFSVADEPWYMKYDLDVIFFLSVLIFVVSVSAFYVFIKVCLFVCAYASNRRKIKSE